MKAVVKHAHLDKEFYTPEQCYITEISNSKDDADLSIARARVAPGITTHWHRLENTAERFYILSGRGRLEIGDHIRQEVTAGDVALIPPMCPQRITNTGNSDLIFLAICTPRFAQEAYEEFEKGQA